MRQKQRMVITDAPVSIMLHSDGPDIALVTLPTDLSLTEVRDQLIMFIEAITRQLEAAAAAETAPAVENVEEQAPTKTAKKKDAA